MSDFEDRLRNSLARHAAEAPSGELLGERIVQAVSGAQPQRRTRSWRAWTLPLIAAGAVGAVVAAVAGIEGYQRETAAPAHSAPASQPASSHIQQVAPPPARPTTAVATPTGTGVLRDVRIFDLTFAGPDDGWALASADCIGKAGRCTALLRTTDGRAWHGIPGAAFNVDGVNNCADPCVEHLRFANDRIGYAYGPTALFLTKDGGRHWTRQAGGADAVETLAGDVIRVFDLGGCPPGCAYRVETAALGSATWRAAELPGRSTRSTGVTVSRSHKVSYLMQFGHPTGGGNDARSTLWTSTDGGASWANRGEPCPQTSGEVDSYAVAAGDGDRVSVLCANRQAPQRWFVATSSDAGVHFTAQPGTIPADAAGPVAPTASGRGVSPFTGDTATVLVSGGTRALAVSADGGRTWQRSATPSGTITFLGFESATVGRAVTDQRTIWTTRDAGATWTPTRFG